MQEDNVPRWDAVRNGFYEVWYLKLNLPEGQALWLRFTTLSLKNGLKKVAETWAMFFDERGGKLALKNTYPSSHYSSSPNGAVKIDHCVFAADHTSGSVVSKSNRIDWDLRFTPNDFTFFHVPKALEKLKLTKSIVCKPNVDTYFTGKFSVNGKQYDCSAAPGCQGHIWGKSYAHSWAWAHCNSFANAPGTAVELLSARVKLGGAVVSPQMSALFVQYKGQRHEFNTLTDAFSIRSKYNLTQWDFSMDKGPLRIVGQIKCDLKDLMAVTYEDTSGGYLYCNNSELASMSMSVYQNGKLENTFTSDGTTGFETVAKERSPYVEVLV